MSSQKMIALTLLSGAWLIDYFDVIPSQILTFILENKETFLLLTLCVFSFSFPCLVSLLLFDGSSLHFRRNRP